MAVYKEEKTNTWRVIYRYTDWTGEKKQTQKRGFKTKREAQAWEREQLHKAAADLDMSFKSFVEQYTADMQTRIKENTWATKEHIIRTKLIPYFGKLKMSSITAQQIITWQNELMNYKDDNGKPLSPVYLKTIHNQLSAIFNHAVKYYNLRENPCKKAGSMGKKKNREMLFWTKEEYLKFAEVMMDKPLSYYAFEMLYWTGIREGELLALTPADFDFEKNTVSINKSYQRLNGQDLITTPKTEKSNRIIIEAQLKSNFRAQQHRELDVFWGIGELKTNLQRIINAHPEKCACAAAFAQRVPPLNLDIFALITDGNTFELLILEIKLMNSAGLKEWSQLVGYCLVSGAKYGLLINVDNGSSPRLSQILSTEDHLSHIRTLVNNESHEHCLGFMQWDSLTQNFEYSNLGMIKSLSELSEHLASEFR